MPLLSAGGVCCCAVDAGLAGVEDPDELDGAGIAVGEGLVVAGGGTELLRLDAEAGAGELGGVELGAGVLAAEVSVVADLLERDFFGLPVAAPVSALSVVSADFFDRLGLADVEDSAAAELSAASADFLDRLFFLGVASASVEVAVASAGSALVFFERLFFVALSAAELSAVELPAASADFFEPFFLLLSATAVSAESALAPFLERLFFVVGESAVAELSGPSELFFFDADFVLLLESALESLVAWEESSGLAFFLDFFFALLELSL